MTKTFSYTPEITETIVAEYVESGNDNSLLPVLADRLGTTVASVRSKLVREGVYVKQQPAKAGKATRTSKAQYVSAIATTLGVLEADVASLEKASLKSLQTVMESLIALGDRPA